MAESLEKLFHFKHNYTIITGQWRSSFISKRAAFFFRCQTSEAKNTSLVIRLISDVRLGFWPQYRRSAFMMKAEASGDQEEGVEPVFLKGSKNS